MCLRKSPTSGKRRYVKFSQTARKARRHRSRGQAAKISTSISRAMSSGTGRPFRLAIVVRATRISAGSPGAISRLASSIASGRASASSGGRSGSVMAGSPAQESLQHSIRCRSVSLLEGVMAC
jgi:hypothetical protein